MVIRSSTRELYSEYVVYMQKIADLKHASAVLQWDQETYLPPKGAKFRGQQIATLAEIAHSFFTNQKLETLLVELRDREDLSITEKKNISLTWEDYSKQKKFESAFVRELSEAINKSFHSWVRSKTENNFSLFEPDLSKVIDLKKQEATLLEYGTHLYDPLLNDHDKGLTVTMVSDLFEKVKRPLQELLSKIQYSTQVDDSFLYQHYPKDKQWQFGLQILNDLHYDFGAGRQDISEHPFSISFNNNDVRITTRINENNLGSMTWSCIHELGHALYEQGLPENEYGLPLSEAASYSIHESQSRLWENHVGRSEAFCTKYFPLLQEYFPEQLKNITISRFYQAINKVQPSLIRTDADELTYHFHVMIRFEIEKALMEGNLKTHDIPAYWNEQYLKYLGITVPSDTFGCLQDVHWSHGSFGYFPTYTLGSFFASQFYQVAFQALGLRSLEITNEHTTSLLNWLRTNIHKRGRMFTSQELCRNITSESLNSTYFLQYLYDKYRSIYNLT